LNAADADGRPARIGPPDDRVDSAWRMVKFILAEPLQARTWSELAFFVLSSAVGAVAVVFIGLTFFVGFVLAIVFVGVVVIAGGLRGVRGIGSWQRSLARHLLGEDIEDPGPFQSRPGFFGWLGSVLRDRASWRALAYMIVKVPLIIFGTWFALSVWFEAAFSLLRGLAGSGAAPDLNGFLGTIVRPSAPRVSLILAGLVLALIAPWTMRLVVYLDRILLRGLLGPDAMTMRVRRLEQSRAQTIDVSAATLRQVERDLHDGTQAQLVALAMRLGQAKEKLAAGEDLDVEAIRRLVDEAHRGAKEAIVELRDIARGIHPPVLDTGLEGALATLTARSPVHTELQVTMQSRPTLAIEAIAYFCVAELLANVAQHARASHASITCAEHGMWLRIAVRDDGRGGAAVNRVGSSSSGLAGLIDRVSTVDGHLSLASPPGGPTVVTVDVPLHV
jgi:signal transduction histidine kinase